jgi:3-deoxy-D-manno-octulosonate 8-phosphate phosphatase (KDO 8-P phosphatase)
MKSIQERIQIIKMLLLDVDGVMTDGGIILGPGSMELKRFHVRDGMGVSLARAAGLLVGILTSRDSEVVRRRAKELGIEEVQQGVSHKEEVYEAILKKYGFRDEEVAYIGDDIQDIPVLKRAGLSCCVADGAEEVKRVSHYVTLKNGGTGAVREVVDMLLKGLGKKEEAVTSLLTPEKKGANR